MRRGKKILSLLLVGAMICGLGGYVEPKLDVYASEVENLNGDESEVDVTTENEITVDEEVVSEEETQVGDSYGYPSVSYYVHVQSYGNQSAVSNGQQAGTVGSSKRLEAIWINLSDTGYEGGIKYTTHVQSYGWRDWSNDGQMSGTSGESKRLEAIKIQLYGEVAEHYDIYYRVHAQTYGWLDWAMNGAPAGTASQSKRLEAIQIKLVAKDDEFYDSTSCSYIELGKAAEGYTGLVNYSTHVQTYGDQTYVCDGSVSGTYGEGKRLEAIHIKLGDTAYDGGIKYSTHVQSYGWRDWTQDGAFNGSYGESKRLEAIKIQLYGEVQDYFDVYYRVHVQSYGWLGWTCNGNSAGTAGFSKRLEGIQIILVPKYGYASTIGYGTYYSPFIDGNDLSNISYYDRNMIISNGRGLNNVTKAIADSWQTTISVPTWDFQNLNSMTKVTKWRSLTVNKYIAKHVQKVFNEIYNSPDQPVIDSGLYAYHYRANVNNTSKLSNHAYGCAIDINAGYNPNKVDGKTYGQWAAMPEGSVSQKQAKAKTLYEGCTIVNTFEKYGFTWGAAYRDAMHFDF